MTEDGLPRDLADGRQVDPEPRRSGRTEVGLRAVQGLLALWLLATPVVLDGAGTAVAVKDVLAGGLLLTLTVAAASTRSARRFESVVCVAVGAALIVASVLLEFGPGPEAAARQWSEVVTGVLLVCLGAARTR